MVNSELAHVYMDRLLNIAVYAGELMTGGQVYDANAVDIGSRLMEMVVGQVPDRPEE